VKQQSIPWASGYQASRRVLASFRAGWIGANRDGPSFPAPILYVTRPDGTILWTDKRARYYHRDPRALAAELEKEIDKALGAPRL
jgi:hypothetical protein